MFALSVKYASVDVSLAVSSGLLPVLWGVCGHSPAALCQAAHVLVYNSEAHQRTDTLLRVASHTLIHILAVTVG